MKIVFATNNAHKLSEIRSILGESIEVLSLKDIGCDVDIPETGTTLEANVLQKAQYIYDHYHMDVFADDTGLEVEALNGAPGVYSARYASLPDNPVKPGNYKLFLNQCFEDEKLKGDLTFKVFVTYYAKIKREEQKDKSRQVDAQIEIDKNNANASNQRKLIKIEEEYKLKKQDNIFLQENVLNLEQKIQILKAYND